MLVLEPDWLVKPPFDLEIKQYELLAYVRDVDLAYMNRTFSPYLLHTEAIYSEIKRLLSQIQKSRESISLRRFNMDTMRVESVVPDLPPDINTILETAEFAEPILYERVRLGRDLHTRYGGLLWK